MPPNAGCGIQTRVRALNFIGWGLSLSKN